MTRKQSPNNRYADNNTKNFINTEYSISVEFSEKKQEYCKKNFVFNNETPRIFMYENEITDISQPPQDKVYNCGTTYAIWQAYVDKLSDNVVLDTKKDSLKNTESSLPNIHCNVLLEKFAYAITEYQEQKSETEHQKNISEKSAKNFLHLIPIFAYNAPQVSIDSDTGYFVATFSAKDNGIFNALITDSGDIHFSLVKRGRKIVKISGTAKIKDSYDLKEFGQVLMML